MADVSNKTLALLVGIALVVSVIGLVAGPKVALTGRAPSGEGIGTLNLLGDLSIDMIDSKIDFLNGTVQSGQVCDLDSAAVAKEATHCEGDWLDNVLDVITVNNTGSVSANITVTSDKNAASWISGTGSTAEYKLHSGTCAGTAQSAYTTLTTGETAFCDDVANGENLNLTLKIQVPWDGSTGAQNATITFTAHQV
ncbi:hypothetical protein ACFLZ7_04310 [Nanoarchaeota archaeon]